MFSLPPLILLAIGVAVVLGGIIWLRLNAFLALISAAMLVSVLAPGPISERMTRVAFAFGNTAGSIGIVIALAAVIGRFMMASGAADRIVLGFQRLLGPNRGAEALTASGFLLSIPVFFDTVFYLLVPLARSMYQRQGRNYLKFLLAIGAGGTVTHSLVPPTPGPLAAASMLEVDLGVAILLSIFIGLPMAVGGLLFATWADRRWPLPLRPMAGESEVPTPLAERDLPGLLASLAPVVLPVLLISGQTILAPLTVDAGENETLYLVGQWAAVVGNANFALLLSAAIAVLVYLSVQLRMRQDRDRHKTSKMIEESLMSGGLIILITSAGGAFGAMLREAGVGEAISTAFADGENTTGISLLLLSFVLASLLKTSQGSSTVAMITTAGIVAAMITPETQLGFHRAYLATAIGCGAIVAAWMNDSGFWIFSRMGGLTEAEALRVWTPITALLGCIGMAMTLLLAMVLPLEETTAEQLEAPPAAVEEVSLNQSPLRFYSEALRSQQNFKVTS